MYYKKQDNKEILDEIEEHSLELVKNLEFEQNWLFVYEVLTKEHFSGFNDKLVKSNDIWILMKEKNISFLRKEFINIKYI